MESNIPREPAFLQELRARDINLKAEIFEAFDLERVQAYYQFLQDFNERGGFFSRGDSERILERHLLESLVFCYYVAQALSVSRETKIADAGSGPGLPGFLFTCLRQTPRVTLIDSSRRRLGLLQEFVETSLGGKRAEFRYGRLEDIKDRFDLTVIRALIPYPFCLELVSALQTKGAHTIYFGAGREPADKPKHTDPNDWTSSYLKNLGFVSRETIRPPEIQFLGERLINILLKSGPAKNGYPRPWKIIRDDMRNRLGAD